MYNLEFKDYLADKTGIDFVVIDELFNIYADVFDVAYSLIENHGVDSKKMGKIWGDYLGFAYVDPSSSIVNKEYINKIGINFIKTNSVLPLYKFGKAVTVSTSDPSNPYILDKVEKRLGELVSFVFCFPFDIDTYLSLNNLR